MSMRKIRRIAIHHSASKDTRGLQFIGIRRWHKEGRNFSTIGYQFVIENVDGEPVIIKGRLSTRRGAHAKGANFDSIGICLVGRDKFSPAVIRRLRALVDEQRAIYGIPRNKVFGHQEVGTTVTECPGDTLMRWVKRYRKTS